MKHLQALAERTEKVCEMAAVMKVCSQLNPTQPKTQIGKPDKLAPTFIHSVRYQRLGF